MDLRCQLASLPAGSTFKTKYIHEKCKCKETLWKKSSKSLHQEKQVTICNSMGRQSIVSFKANWVPTKKDILTVLAQDQATNKQTAIKKKSTACSEGRGMLKSGHRHVALIHVNYVTKLTFKHSSPQSTHSKLTWTTAKPFTVPGYNCPSKQLYTTGGHWCLHLFSLIFSIWARSRIF